MMAIFPMLSFSRRGEKRVSLRETGGGAFFGGGGKSKKKVIEQIRRPVYRYVIVGKSYARAIDPEKKINKKKKIVKKWRAVKNFFFANVSMHKKAQKCAADACGARFFRPPLWFLLILRPLYTSKSNFEAFISIYLFVGIGHCCTGRFK